MATKTPDHLYHYTIGAKLPLIAASGALEPRGFGAAPKEKSILWLSENPQWEPTANKAMSLDGGKTFIRPTLVELQKAVGIFRFRIDTQRLASVAAEVRLVPWTRIGTVAHISASHMADMVRRGIAFGATPMHWWGCMSALPLALVEHGALIIEERALVAVGQQQKWVQVSLNEAIASFEALGTRVHMSTATETPAARNI